MPPGERTPRRTSKAAKSTVDDDQEASGQTNVDSPQRTEPEPDQGEYVPPVTRWRVIVRHNHLDIGDTTEDPGHAVGLGFVVPDGQA